VKALVLTGGGALGAYEAGVICGLAEAGQKFDLVCGTSIGAINAAFFAQDKWLELESLWRSISGKNIIKLSDSAQHIADFVSALEDFLKLPKIVWPFHIPSLLGKYRAIGPMAELRTMLGVLDRSAIATLLQPQLSFDGLTRSLVITGTNATLQTSESFYAFVAQPEGVPVNQLQENFLRNATLARPLTAENFLIAVEASGSIPFAFSPMTENLGTPNTYMYVDGGVANNTPIGVAVAAGATDVTAIFLNPRNPQPTPQNISDVLVLGLACYGVMQQKILDDDIKLALITNKALAGKDDAQRQSLELGGKLEVSLRQVRPASPLGLSVLGFSDQDGINAAFDLGKEDSRNVQTLWEAN
jgi:predicted acylesterase/phospholipase RssA